MKPDINTILNKLISYACDDLLLDTLDETYTLNRLATACGVAAPVRDESVELGDATLGTLIAELKSVCPEADIAAVTSALFPMPRTVNYYFSDALERNPKKAFEFLFELYASGYNMLTCGEAYGADGFIGYASGIIDSCAAVALPACGDLKYIPKAMGAHVGALENPDVTAEDVFSREAAFVAAYGGAIAARLGSAADYCTADACALSAAKVKTELASGAVKTALLDYPVPALAFSGIAKNAVLREATRVAAATVEAGYRAVLAAAANNGGVTLYIVFAGNVDKSEYVVSDDALTACGVFAAPDYSALVSVLEKGTALSTDLTAFKPLYEQIGGVKLGNKAAATLGGAIVDKFKPMLAAAASCSEEQAVALAAKNE